MVRNEVKNKKLTPNAKLDKASSAETKRKKDERSSL